jgi:flagellar basal-body rod modification protein FlgD
MQSQDPFEPMDNTQMVAQMAQFSQLAASNSTNSLLTSIADSVSGTRLSDAASWIGKSMLVTSNIAAPDGYGQYAGELTLGAKADAVSVDLINSSGAVVKTIDLGAQDAGTASFYWDGKDADGNQLSTENLQVKVRGATPTQTSTWTHIAAVQSPTSGTDTKLITTLGSFSPSDAQRIG